MCDVGGACVCGVTGEGEGVRGAMLQSFLDVAGEDGADKSSPGTQRGRREVTRREIKLSRSTRWRLTIKVSLRWKGATRTRWREAKETSADIGKLLHVTMQRTP